MMTKDPRRQRGHRDHRLEVLPGVPVVRSNRPCGPSVPRHVICIAMIWYLITSPERPNLTAGASKTVWVQGFLNRQKQTLDDASVPNCFHGGFADWTNTTRILLQTCNTIVPFYCPGGVNRLVAFPNRQHRLILIAAQQRYNGRVESPSPRLTRGGTGAAISARLFFLSRRKQRRRCGTSQPQAQHVVISAHRLILCVARCL
jgi:hypothetical protein